MPYIFRIQAHSQLSGAAVTQFTQRIRYTIDFSDLDPADWGNTFVQLYTFNEAVQKWQPVPSHTDMHARRTTAMIGHFTDFGFGGDVNSLPSTPSSVDGFSVDLCAGAATASVPLILAPGISGIGPQLVLRYNSGIVDALNANWIAGGNSTANDNTRNQLQASPVGLGWSLDLGAIFRSTSTDAAGNTIYYLVFGGRTYELGWVDGVTFRTKPDEYLRVRKMTGAPNDSSLHEYWLIEAKDGTQYRYGYNKDSEQRAGTHQFSPTGAQVAWQWCLDQVQDLQANTMGVQYLETVALPNPTSGDTVSYDQAAYPQVITYTSNAGQGFAGNRQIKFSYSARTDQATNSSYTYTQYYWTQKLDRIEVRVRGMLAKSYNLSYSYQTPSWHVRDLGNQQTYVQAITADAPLGWWRLGETTGSTAVDSSGPSLSGSYVGNPGTIASVTGALADGDPAIRLDGASDYVDVNSAPSILTGTGPQSIEAWFAASGAVAANAELASKATDASGCALVFPSSNTLAGAFGNGSSRILTSSYTFSLNTWYHVAAAFDGSRGHLYVNGVEVTPAVTVSMVGSNAAHVVIGKHHSQATYFAGVVDEVAVYGSALSLARIQAHFNAAVMPATVPGPPSPAQITGLSKLVLSSITEQDGSGNALPSTGFTYGQGTIAATSESYKSQLLTIVNGYGGTISYGYQGHTPDGWWNLPRRYRVSQMQLDPSTGSIVGTASLISKLYAYGTSYNVPGSVDYRGHGQVTVTDAAGHFERTYFYTRDALTWTSASGPSISRTVEDVAVLQMLAYATEKWASGASSFTVRGETAWNYTPTAGGANFLHADEARSYQSSLGSGILSRKTDSFYDSYGNVVASKEYDSASAASDFWKRNRIREFYPSVTGTRYIVDRLAREILYTPSGDPLRDSRFCYDGSWKHTTVIGSGTNGDDGSYRARLTAVRRILDPTHCVDVTYGYDGYGHQTSMTEYGVYGTTGGALATGDPRTTNVVFESQFATFPAQVTNPLGQQASRLYDSLLMLPISSTDVNGGIGQYTYDGWGRLLSAQGAQMAGPNGAYRRTTQYTYFAPSTSGNGRTTTVLKKQVRTDLGGASPTWLNSWSVYDGLGRVIQSYADAAAGGVNVANTYFDTRGLVWRTSVPHAGAGADQFIESDWSSFSGLVTRSAYDELARATVVTLPDGKTGQTSYDGWAGEAIDQNGHKRRNEADAFGRVVTVREYTGTGSGTWTQYAATSYGYDVADQLLNVVDAVSNQTTISYDSLGRKIGMADPDMGTWSYLYDPIGTLQSQVDANRQQVDFFYDALKRPVRTWYPASWTTSSPSQPCVYDLIEMRAAIDVDRKTTGLIAGSWSDPAIVAGKNVPVCAAHFTELLARIQDLWTAAGMGTIPLWTAQATLGALVAGTRLIVLSDLTDLRAWLVQYENSTYGQSHRARTYSEYDAYDGATQFGRGRRTALWDVTGHQTSTYDLLGRRYQGQQTLDGFVYAANTTFDAADRPYQATLPDLSSPEVLTYGYMPNGQLGTLSSSLGDTLVSGVSYNPLNLPTQYTIGGGGTNPTATLQQHYYGLDVNLPTSGTPFGALQAITLQAGANPKLVDRTLNYDAVGNILSIVDATQSPSETINYTFDHLDRLLNASAPAGESFAYNQIGNISTKNGVALSYPAAGQPRPHAVTSFNGTNYTYDATGSLPGRGTQTIVYDPLRRPVRVESGGSTLYRVAYDGDGVRRKRLDANGVVHYLGGYERNVGTGANTTETVTKYYAALGRLVAYRKNGVLSWVGTDHLGGTVRVADHSFNPIDSQRYTPFGVSRDAGTGLGVDHLYTGQIQDQSIGLYWYAAEHTSRTSASSPARIRSFPVLVIRSRSTVMPTCATIQSDESIRAGTGTSANSRTAQTPARRWAQATSSTRHRSTIAAVEPSTTARATSASRRDEQTRSTSL